MEVPSKFQNRVPPGQVQTGRFPVVGEKISEPPKIDLDAWRLELRVHDTLFQSYPFDVVRKLPTTSLLTDIHCVTGWTRLDANFQGVRFEDFLRHIDFIIPSTAKFVRFLAYSSRGHDTSMPVELALQDAWLIHSFDGRPLSPDHGFPLRVLVPSRYFYKSLKWLKAIEFLETDRLGFWERTTGYHNEADPWKEQRLDATRFSSKEECDRFRQLSDFDAYRSSEGEPKVIVRADFSDWDPMTRDLRGLHLKSCDFSNAQLKGADFRDANLTFGRFMGADLEGVDLTGADLEGCDFSGANLTGAKMHGCFLSAARFMSTENPSGSRIGLAKWDRLEVANPDGLLEEQETYLRQIGVLKESG